MWWLPTHPLPPAPVSMNKRLLSSSRDSSAESSPQGGLNDATELAPTIPDLLKADMEQDGPTIGTLDACVGPGDVECRRLFLEQIGYDFHRTAGTLPTAPHKDMLSSASLAIEIVICFLMLTIVQLSDFIWFLKLTISVPWIRLVLHVFCWNHLVY